MVLVVDRLSTTFPVGPVERGERRRVPIVDDVSFTLEKGKCLGLVGESGSGKSMTALSLLRLVPRPGRVESGSVKLDGQELTDLSVTEMRRVRGRKIGMIFQEPMTSLNPVVRVGDQVMEALLLHEKVSRKAARSRGIELFRRVGIPDPEARFETYPHQMSGGLKQRVMISMALVTRPQVLLADEPTTALDVTIQAQIIELLRELQRDFETAILLITHDLGIVNELADEVAVLYAGRIVERAPTVALLSAPSHPYARGLLGAIPSRSAPGERLHEIRGNVPSPSAWPRGCRFHPRCPEVFEPCAKEIPALLSLRAAPPGAPVEASTNPERRSVACHARVRDAEAAEEAS